MMEIFKRYSLALVILFVVVFMMLIGTMGVMEFGQKMVNDIGGQEMKPRGKVINK